MVRIAEDAGYDFDLLKGVVTVNDEQLHRVAAKIVDLAGGSVRGQADRGVGPHLQGPHRRPARVAVAGGDRAPRGAGRRGARPSTRPGPGPLEGIEVVDDPYAAVEGAEVLAVLTEWDEFRWLDIDKVADLMAAKNVVDARNLLDRAALVRRGFEYRGHRPQLTARRVPSRRAPDPALRRTTRHRRRGPRPGSASGRAAAPAARGAARRAHRRRVAAPEPLRRVDACRTSSPT